MVTITPAMITSEFKDIKRGFVCGDSKQDHLQEAESLQAKAIIIQHSGLIQNGYTLVLDYDTSRIAFKFTEITSKIDRKTNKKHELKPKFIKT
ncbi:MAG: putative translation elongation factor-1 alpha [Streblomastix strix]|uniref:Putative translation elongation factor-1 alpha n=1 Tax=Streblomastix strix TaxID=222440 RepID=A0A5J4UY64_9EUKA|nr:MAG: putative translation elongation factor-1 alpha [Streblomastix strix]